jgi:hypothetical protein
MAALTRLLEMLLAARRLADREHPVQRGASGRRTLNGRNAAKAFRQTGWNAAKAFRETG